MCKERLRLSISFREEYRHLFEHLQKQPNRSDYICRILQKELEQKKSLEEKIANLLNLISAKNNIINTDATTDSFGQTEQILKINDIDLINNLF